MAKNHLLFKYSLIVVSASYLLAYFYMVYHRIQYPFELEWIEGGFLGEVQRIVNGQPVYVAPSLGFVPFIYTPLYFYISAFVSLIFGATFFSLRLVSFIASLASFALIFLIVKEETKDNFAAFVSVCFFAATFRVTGAWMDVARVDSLFFALLLAFVYFIRRKDSSRSYIMAGLFMALIFLTKQVALVMCLPVIGYAMLIDWKRTSLPILTAIAGVGIVTIVFDIQSNGWYSYYIFELLKNQSQWPDVSEFMRFWPRDLFAHGTIALLFLTFYFYKTWHTQNGQLWGVVFLGVLAGSYVTKLKLGGYDNVLLPLYGVLAILLGLGGHKMLEMIRDPKGDLKEAGVYLALIVQMANLFYNPINQIPTKDDLKAGQEFVHFLSTQEGKIYLPDHPYLLALAEKETHAHNSAIWDILRGEENDRGKVILQNELSEAIRNQAYAMIIIDTEYDILPNHKRPYLNRYYWLNDRMFQGTDHFYPVTGTRMRPEQIYIPKK